ncbi:hypothetical protein SteCoe_9584 [Stentor coeruleus]|uniref:Amino acid transporter transmembrane domain-containing protein n=1 Tax=Stentor coeruleus TaxID=5963 RepID=A0A1R2CHH4_9CILI|nr:hypothetical protein SteCoe_9584 [Stentor coeruleus]
METQEEKFSQHFALILNTILNPAMLCIPYAFSTSGTILSIFVLISFTFMGSLLAHMLIEIHYKAAHIQLAKDEGNEINFGVLDIFSYQDKKISAYENSNLNRKVDTIYSMTILLGTPFGLVMGILGTVLSMLLLIISYVVFASTLALEISISTYETCDIYSQVDFFSRCRIIYFAYLCVFLILLNMYIVKGIDSQLFIQKITCIVRVLIVLITIISSIVLLLKQSTVNSGEYKSIISNKSFDLDGFKELIPVAISCMIVQPQLASIYQLTGRAPSFSRMIKFSLACCIFLLLPLGIIVPPALDEVQKDFTRNFKDYSAGFMWHQRPIYSLFIEHIIKFLGPITAFSSSLIVGITFHNNWLNYFIEKKIEKKYTSCLMYFLITFVPFVFACFSPDFNTVIKISGVIAVGSLVFIIPIAHIAGKSLSEFNSDCDIKKYNKMGNLFVAAIGVILTIALVFSYS